MRTSILFFVILGMAGTPAMADSNSCSPQMTKGYWAFNCEGYATPTPPAPQALVPARFFGTCDADRTALFDCEGTLNVGGFVVPAPVILHGQGTTNKDCTGMITYQESIGGQDVGTLTIRYTVLDGGDTIWGLPVGNAPPSPQVLSCNLRRISK